MCVDIYISFPGGKESTCFRQNPSFSGRESACQCRRCSFDPRVGEDPLEKAVATHSSIIAWEIPQSEKPGRLQSIGSQKNWTQLSAYTTTSLVAQMVKHLPAMWETWVQSLGQQDPLEKEMATHSNTLAWKIPQMKEPSRLQSVGSQRVRHD